METVNRLVSEITNQAYLHGIRQEQYNDLKRKHKKLQETNEELLQAYEKLRLHCNTLAADKKQIMKECDHYEKVIVPENESLKVRLLDLEKVLKESEPKKYSEMFKLLNPEVLNGN